MKYCTLKVIALRVETSDVVTVIFKQPALKKISYLPGQYLTLIFKINGRRYIRPYSFSSAPIVDANLEVTVKRVPGGIVSNHIVDKLGVGDLVEVMEPMGNFTLNHDFIKKDTHLVLWGAGSGITPLMSIAKYALKEQLVEHVNLVYGNRNFEQVIFNDQIKRLEGENSNFSAWHFLTQSVISENNPYLIQGRIEPEKVLAIMGKEDDLTNTVHYICGPSGLKESLNSSLLTLGIDKRRIFSEDFEIVRDPAEFKNIKTRSVSITKDENQFTVEVIKGKSILEAGLDAMLDLSYSCQTGNCLVCKGKLVKGEIKTIGISELPAGLSEHEYLLCCSFPITEDVEIVVE